MRPFWRWYSVSTRLSLILLGLTTANLLGLGLVLGSALNRYFIEEAQVRITRNASVFAEEAALTWDDTETIQRLSSFVSKEGLLQAIVFDADGQERLRGEDVHGTGVIPLPEGLIQNTLSNGQQTGQFELPEDLLYPWWMYSTSPIYSEPVDSDNVLSEALLDAAQPVGVIYVAMPLRQPRLFARRVTNRVILIVVAATGISAVVSLQLSRSITQPLQRLRNQAVKLKVGDYEARSSISGKDELADLSALLNDMAAQLSETLQSLSEQETARRELVANISHDLRTPLASLRLQIEAVLDGLVVGDQADEHLRRARRETDFLTRLVEQLLFLAQADAGMLQMERQAVSAVAIAQECLSRIEPIAAQSGTPLQLNAKDDLPKVWVDPALIGAVVLNLLDNAVKYAPSDDGVVVNVGAPVGEEHEQYIPLEVRDYGPGMEPAVLEKVTERFYRADSARPKGSLGLGMAIAQQVCQMQNVILQIRSQPEKGTRVTLLLPVHTD